MSWTTARLAQWILKSLGVCVCRETVRLCLKRLGFSWKKAKKLLNKAKPESRRQFLETLKPLLKRANDDEILLVYMDEAHKHPDTSLGHGWSPQGERLWVSSHSNGLGQRTSLYGLYLYNEGTVRIWDYPTANQENTQHVLERLRQEFPKRNIKLIWDGASYHRAKSVYQKAGSLGIEIIQLPGYSPDFMPVEELWSWLRKELNDFHCFKNTQEFLNHVRQFLQIINQNTTNVADRLWRSIRWDSQLEKLRVSN